MKDKNIDFEMLRKRREKVLKLRAETEKDENQHIGLGYVLTVDRKQYPVMAFLSERIENASKINLNI